MNLRKFAASYIAAIAKAFRDGDFADLAALEDPRVVYHLGELGDLVGPEAHAEDIRRWRAAVPGLVPEARFVTGDGNLFVLAVKEAGRIAAAHPVFPLPVGKRYAGDFLEVVRVARGRVAEVWGNGSVTFLD